MIHWKVEQREEWNTAVANSPDGGFLQSWEWGAFQESLGNAVFNLSNENKTWFAQCIQLKAGNRWILSIPRGPVFMGAKPEQESFLSFMKEIRAFAKERGCFLVRFDPPFLNPHPPISILESPIRKSHKHTNPEHTLILDTSGSEEELLAAMKSKWRYNIKVAQKYGLSVRWGSTPADAEQFAALMNKTTDRQDFASYDAEYFKTLISTLGAKHEAAFLFAEYQGEPIAALLLCFFGKMAIYLHGGSDYEHRNMMAPHLLQWEAIKEAKSRKMNYDFWGVAAEPPANKAEEGWKGVTRFKKGFAPKTAITEYMGTHEISVQPFWYLLYRLRGLMK